MTKKPKRKARHSSAVRSPARINGHDLTDGAHEPQNAAHEAIADNGSQPWSVAKRAEIKADIDHAAGIAAKVLKAKHVMMVVFYEEGQYLHLQDGGTAPMAFEDVYLRMISAHQMMAETNGEDVGVQ